jgi:hypothetical protein
MSDVLVESLSDVRISTSQLKLDFAVLIGEVRPICLTLLLLCILFYMIAIGVGLPANATPSTLLNYGGSS